MALAIAACIAVAAPAVVFSGLFSSSHTPAQQSQVHSTPRGGARPLGFTPIVVMDAWEHAFVPDYKPTERAKYVDAYFKNLDWRACEARLIK